MDWEYPKTFSAARKGQWDLADALAEEVRGRDIEKKIAACAAELAERGVEYSGHYLERLRGVSRVFPKGTDRPVWLTTEMAIQAGDKTVLRKAVEMAEEEGALLSKRYIMRVRQAMTQHITKTTGVAPRSRSTGGSKPRSTTDEERQTRKVEIAHAKENASTGSLRSAANISALESMVLDARSAARKFLEKASGIELDKEYREHFTAEIDLLIESWKTVRSAIRSGKIADEAEEWLKAQL